MSLLLFIATIGERKSLGQFHLDNETIEADTVCPSNSAIKVVRSRKALRPRPLFFNLFPTFATIKVVNCARGTFTLASAEDAILQEGGPSQQLG